MFNKFFIFIFISILSIFYQNHSHSKSTSFYNFNSKDFSNYFSGIVAFENRSNLEALKFFNLSKALLDEHDPYLKRYITTLILENDISKAINVVKNNFEQNNTDFFEAHLLLILDSLKKKNFDQANIYSKSASNFLINDRFNEVILETLRQYIFVFRENRIPKNKENLGNLSIINETFQRCYLDDQKTQSLFLNLINKTEADYTRYQFFYLNYLVEKNKFEEAKQNISMINYINSTLLLSQGKNWIENENFKKFKSVFSCKNHNHVVSEFLFLISNLYSSQDNYEKSNFYLNLSNFLNPKFIYNLSLVAENFYLNKEYKKANKILKKFKKEDIFYFWYKIKKEAQIIAQQKSKKESLDYITSEFNKIKFQNNKMIFDIANFYKNFEDYDTAIDYYSKVIKDFNDESTIKSDLLYRRGGSYERKGDYINSDKDLLESLNINPDDAYVLNYLAYSWLERNYRIDEAIKMLEIAYAKRSDDPYIIDSIGWAYYLIDNFLEAEIYLKRAVELMPDDPIVNDHYGDILWKLDRKIQARYFWKNVLQMDDVEKELIEKINDKLLRGLKNS